MATNFITNISTVSYSIGGGNTLVVTQAGRLVSSTDGVTDTGYNTQVSVYGEIHAADYGLRLDNINGFSVGSHMVNIGKDGVISSATNNAIFLDGDNNKVVNHGDITVDSGSGFAALFTAGDNTDILNTGTITGNYGISNLGISSVGTLDVINSGSIYGSQFGLNVSSQNLDLFNSGTIQGLTYAIRMASGSVNANIVNTGLIETFDLIAISLNTGNDKVINTGLIAGNVLMSGGNDIYDGRDGGRVIGSVSGGSGDDSYYISDRSTDLLEGVGTFAGIDIVYATVNYTLGANFENLTLLEDAVRGVGNSAANIITGNIGDNRLRGLAGDDVISGAQGDDIEYGGIGADTLNGGIGDDILKGGKDNDILNGDSDDDVLRGQRGADTLYGGDGQDRLIGGRGKDVLFGGDDADVFVFNRATDSTNDGNRDEVRGFVQGEDLIDLSGLPGNLTFIGTGAFTGTGPEARVVYYPANGNTDILINLDDDLLADMRINVKNVTVIEVDLIL